jgi:hypothetical protein
MLSCTCDFADPEWPVWYQPDDFSEMPHFARRKRCADKDCRRLINAGEPVARISRSRYARTDIEIDIYGEDEDAIALAEHYLCEECAGIFFSLVDLGFCIFYEHTRESLAEYQQLTLELKERASHE